MRTAKCGQCGRERTPQDRDFDPFNAIMDGRVGWYSGSNDGEICPEEMTALMQRANPRLSYRPDIAARS